MRNMGKILTKKLHYNALTNFSHLYFPNLIICRQLIAILKSTTPVNDGQTSIAKTEISPSYQEDFRKFIEDSVTSLGSHTRHFSEKLGDISEEYQRFLEVWNNRLNGLRDSAIKLLGENRILDVELFKFKKQL